MSNSNNIETADFTSQTPPHRRRIAAAFRRWGWIGFWSQLILGFIPVILVTFQLFFSSKSQLRGGLDSGNILSFLDLLTLFFTIYWCFRYTRLGIQLEDSKQYPSSAKVIREVWIGIIANVGVIFLAVLIGIGTVGGLLYVVLSMPQGGATILQPTPGGKMISPGPIIVPMDMLGLLAVMSVILAGLLGLMVSLWLMHRASTRSK
ncbi:hypothetical protein PCC7418_2889 [Halothece sp. PCC 7418]|uniref:DUF3611 family protein n=1 Tax=Halothece sp. (strain PCC 7418) TaxID=65093 RepID=UPI0002A07CA6|nr:DUF3611 family protein [Halothece sp. PCC 7418]AFZ45019.1 hypothetical protein PCC7418_2889 [Halothece sp. PCC 7418]